MRASIQFIRKMLRSIRCPKKDKAGKLDRSLDAAGRCAIEAAYQSYRNYAIND